MHNLYFIRSNGEKRLIRENIDPDKAMGYINEYIAQLNPKYKDLKRLGTVYYLNLPTNSNLPMLNPNM